MHATTAIIQNTFLRQVLGSRALCGGRDQGKTRHWVSGRTAHFPAIAHLQSTPVPVVLAGICLFFARKQLAALGTVFWQLCTPSKAREDGSWLGEKPVLLQMTDREALGHCIEWQGFSF